MSKTINRATILGSLGKDPEIKYTPQGKAVANLSIATNEHYKKDGEWTDRTEWHTVVLWERLAEIAGEYLKKGSQVYIEGQLQTRKWTDKEGQERYTTAIRADRMQMLGSRSGGSERMARPDDDAAPARSTAAPAKKAAGAGTGGGF